MIFINLIVVVIVSALAGYTTDRMMLLFIMVTVMNIYQLLEKK